MAEDDGADSGPHDDGADSGAHDDGADSGAHDDGADSGARDEGAVDDDYLEGVDVGAGCTEIWEHLAERRREDRDGG